LGVIKYPIAIVGFAVILAGCGSRGGPSPAGDLAQAAVAAEEVTCGGGSSASNSTRPANYREVSVIAKASDGAPVPLSRNDLRLTQDGQEIAIQSFVRESASVGILVDTSASTDEKIPQARNAITDLIRGLAPDDDIFLFAFSSRAYMLQSFTTNHEVVVRELSLLRANGETALFDTIVQGLLKIRHGCYERKALFVLTDGMDNASSST
jgi:VWFA-related protein